MELGFKHQVGVVCAILLLPALCSCYEYATNSRASYYSSPGGYGNPRGACGYGEYGMTMNNGNVVAVSGGLWRNGAGCGACYKVWCKRAEYCNAKGVYVVATDYGEGDRTEFIMSKRGFSELGKNAAASAKLLKEGVVNISFKRVPCTFPSNIKLHVHESSKNPSYFALVLLNVNGMSDITAVEIWHREQKRWEPLRRAYGAVFDFANPPTGQIRLRFQLGYKYWLLPKIPIPANWKSGATYDSQLEPY
ncbi:expansin-like B1 [Vigna umbellata]|uniref:expansin-like B1 n=1 Tax=Vigna umbellata TaxID=87088 RepID=UPI001F5F4761|nr:expansin-like B1 [Vigna umbellata]